MYWRRDGARNRSKKEDGPGGFRRLALRVSRLARRVSILLKGRSGYDEGQ